MKAVISLLVGTLASSAVATDVSDVPVDRSALPDGYTIVPFSMKGSIEPGGELMTFNGTVTDIFEQIRNIKPDFQWNDFNSTITPSPAGHVSRRTKDHILCNIPFHKPGSRFGLLLGYDYLTKLHHDCQVDGGPKVCAAMWCCGGNSIYFCNDNMDPISRDCGYLASYVLDIVANEDCVSGKNGMLVQGQEFDTDGFNIVAGADGDPKCFCNPGLV
ncbi:hypothetical protein M426DRAFT_320211 [Hypoxylon sp. CI-4A]|nr:hypothetical protein M426DRAFT_320211 [Hypoxylon sp. CI-4A]